MQKGNTLKVPVTGQVTGQEEIEAIIEVAKSGQYAPDKKVRQFEQDFAKFIGKKYALFVNSGSSANLLAVTAWAKYHEKDNLECILPALMFPTTLNPYIHNNFSIKLIDVDIATLQTKTLEKHGVHTLGNYADISSIEDSCDGMLLGHYKGEIQTFSFFPAHFLTTGEGGMVTTDDIELYKLMKSISEWGKNCFCNLGYDNACGKRFDQQFGEMPYGYDHKYIYSNIGYNLANTEMAAAIGIEQLKKLPSFLDVRRKNFKKLYNGLSKFSSDFILPRTVMPDTAWFSFPLTIRKNSKLSRRNMVEYLNDKGVASRPIMGGNIKRQPAYLDIKFKYGGVLENSDIITENSFYIGLWHGLSDEQIEYSIDIIEEFMDIQ
jgi:CDP-6-deoxy-D-xylo-4-hexulose-3-dehydrase